MAQSTRAQWRLRSEVGIAVCTCGLSLFSIIPAKAQDAASLVRPAAGSQAAGPATAGEADAGPTVAELVVTAQKREQRLQDVAASVTALSSGQLEALGAKNLQDFSRTVPGLALVQNSVSGASTPIIRGIASLTGAATVGFYLDDTPLQARPGGLTSNPDPVVFDIDRVEVLRGPQGTLYGSSSMGGTIKFITAQPSLTTFSGRVRGEVNATQGGDPGYEAGAAFGGPIVTDKVGFRVSAYDRRDGGYVDRVSRTTGAVLDTNINHVETGALRGALLLKPLEHLEIEPAVYYQTQRAGDLPTFQSNLPRFSQNNTSRQPVHDAFVLPSLTIRYDLGFATATSVTSYLSRDQRLIADYSTLTTESFSGQPIVPFFPNYVAQSHNLLTQRNVTQEFRLTSNGKMRLQWIVGAFYLNTEQRFQQSVVEPSLPDLIQGLFGVPITTILGLPLLPGGVSFFGDSRTTEKQLAGFGEGTFAVTERLKLTAGLRVSRSELDLARNTNGPLNGGPNSLTGVQKETPITPKFGASYQLQPDALLYVSAAKGFRVGGVNPAVPLQRCAADLAALGAAAPPGTYNSDSLWSYEAGAKTQSFGRRLTLNGDVFRIDWDDIQQGLSLPGCGFGYTTNLGSARSQGAELEAQFSATRNLTLAANLSYTDATLSQDVFSSPDPKTGQRVTIGRSGDRVLGIPKWLTAVSAEYHRPLPLGLRGYARADFQYLGSYFRSLPAGEAGYDPANFRGKSYGYGSIRFGLLTPDGWDVSAFINNIADSRPIIGADDGLNPASGILRETTLRPRTFGLTASRAF